MARWYNKVEEAGFHSFNVIATTFYEHLEKETKENQKQSFRHKKRGFDGESPYKHTQRLGY